jgi:hypothetical protein
MGPKSLTNLFSYKSEKTNYNLREISSGLSLPNPRTNINMKNNWQIEKEWLIKIIEKEWQSIPLEFYSKGN